MSRDEQIRDAVDRFLSRVRKDTDAHLETLASDLFQFARGGADAGESGIEHAAVDIARAVAKGGAHARHDLIARVTAAIRRLDDATTLRGILDALVEGAAEEALRVAVLVVDGGVLRAYRHLGFPPGALPVDVPLDRTPATTSAVRLRQTVVVKPADDADTIVPAFMRVGRGHAALLLPLVVERAVVALVYAEGPEGPGTESGGTVWRDEVEVLVRHGSARLESVTSLRTVEVLTGPS